jgi:mono/diheme cytochrome c family protein
MRQLVRIVPLALAALVLAGCGGGETVSPVAEEVEGTLPQMTTEVEEITVKGDPDAGAEVFAANGCGSCHTLAKANASGTVGPNFDEAPPSFERAFTTITNGRGGMPAFGEQLSEQQIADVAAYVAGD